MLSRRVSITMVIFGKNSGHPLSIQIKSFHEHIINIWTIRSMIATYMIEVFLVQS